MTDLDRFLQEAQARCDAQPRPTLEASWASQADLDLAFGMACRTDLPRALAIIRVLREALVEYGDRSAWLLLEQPYDHNRWNGPTHDGWELARKTIETADAIARGEETANK